MIAVATLASNTDQGMRQVAMDIRHVGELLFTTAAEGLVVVDREGTILLHNPRLNEMFGHTGEELKGRPIEDLLPDAARAHHVHHRANYAEHPVPRSMGMGMDLWGQRKDGSIFPVEVSLNHFNVKGRMYVMGLITDVTLRHEAEQALHRSKQDLEERVEQRTAELREAEKSVRAALEKERELHQLKSRFVAMASHEFRTPLSTIMGSVDLIGRYATGDEKVDKHVKRIRSKVRELTSMLNEFLSLERIEQGQTLVNPTSFDIIHHCIEQIEELRGLAKAGQSIDYDHSGEERTIGTDRQMLGHVITNLVTNAVKYSPENKPIMLRTTIHDGSLRITVQDRGMGIPMEDQQHLFERFFRGGNVMTIQGTGLGLNIVKRYLDLLGGTITFTSEPGNTVFHVEVPLIAITPKTEPQTI
ncbi:MAG: PAS domain-containing sensor histidine kinase [Flavobacteriales bacterium]|nr:PAS domain-containing sensor histidine kinase [Flavobacteriales bacterium]